MDEVTRFVQRRGGLLETCRYTLTPFMCSRKRRIALKMFVCLFVHLFCLFCLYERSWWGSMVRTIQAAEKRFYTWIVADDWFINSSKIKRSVKGASPASNTTMQKYWDFFFSLRIFNAGFLSKWKWRKSIISLTAYQSGQRNYLPLHDTISYGSFMNSFDFLLLNLLFCLHVFVKFVLLNSLGEKRDTIALVKLRLCMNLLRERSDIIYSNNMVANIHKTINCFKGLFLA